MDKNLTIPHLIDAINEKKHSDVIDGYIEVLADNIEEAFKLPLFYSLPLEVILSIVRKINFFEQKDLITLINDISSKTNEAYEKESILLLNCFSFVKILHPSSKTANS